MAFSPASELQCLCPNFSLLIKIAVIRYEVLGVRTPAYICVCVYVHVCVFLHVRVCVFIYLFLVGHS